EPVHLGQDLVQRLLALVAAAEPGNVPAARAADRVELVDEHDRRRSRLRLREEVADARRAHADDRLDELGRRLREEGHVRLARDRASEQRLAGSRRPREQDAARDASAEPPELVRALQELDDLAQLRLRLVDPGHVREGHARAGRLVTAGLRPAERAEHALDAPPAATHPEDQEQGEERWAAADA